VEDPVSDVAVLAADAVIHVELSHPRCVKLLARPFREVALQQAGGSGERLRRRQQAGGLATQRRGPVMGGAMDIEPHVGAFATARGEVRLTLGDLVEETGERGIAHDRRL